MRVYKQQKTQRWIKPELQHSKHRFTRRESIKTTGAEVQIPPQSKAGKQTWLTAKQQHMSTMARGSFTAIYKSCTSMETAQSWLEEGGTQTCLLCSRTQ